MQHRYFGKYASYYLFSVAYHKIPLAQLTLLASRINAPQQPPKNRWIRHLHMANALTVILTYPRRVDQAMKFSG